MLLSRRGRLFEHRVEVSVIDAVLEGELPARVFDAAEHHQEELTRDLPRLAPHADSVEDDVFDELRRWHSSAEAERDSEHDEQVQGLVEVHLVGEALDRGREHRGSLRGLLLCRPQRWRPVTSAQEVFFGMRGVRS